MDILTIDKQGEKVSLDGISASPPKKTDRDAAKQNYLRVIDESGEDYLYPAAYFAHISLPSAVRKALLATG